MFLHVNVVITARKRSLRRLCFYRCLSVHRGACVVARMGGHVWLLPGGMCGCSQGGHAWLPPRGACMVARGGAWLLTGGGMHGCSWGGCMVGCSQGGLGGMHGCSWGGMRGCSRGASVVALGGMRGCSWGACMVAPGGACMVALGGHAWLLPGGHVWLLLGGHAWLLGGGVHGFFDEIQSMSGWYASYWNAFLFKFKNLQLLIFEYFNFSALM